MDKEIKLGIALPLVDKTVSSAFFDSWVLLEKPPFIYIRPSFPNVDIAKIRNDLVNQALKSECTHLLMMDTDQTFPGDTIEKLLSHDKDVVTAPVHRRYPPFDALLMRGDVPGKLTLVPDEEIERKELIKVDATGAGCVLYNMDVFKKIPQPWFEFTIGEDGKTIGEDIGFCFKLKEHGFPIFTDCSIFTGHLSTLEINYNTYKLYKFMKKIQNEK